MVTNFQKHDCVIIINLILRVKFFIVRKNILLKES